MKNNTLGPFRCALHFFSKKIEAEKKMGPLTPIPRATDGTLFGERKQTGCDIPVRPPDDGRRPAQRVQSVEMLPLVPLEVFDGFFVLLFSDARALTYTLRKAFTNIWSSRLVGDLGFQEGFSLPGAVAAVP